MTDIVQGNGTSNTYLVGEKYLNPQSYFDGSDPGDNETMYVGFDNDTYRCAYSRPERDFVGRQLTKQFGSSHPAGFNMLYCDGSVRLIEYGVTLTVHQAAANRLGQ
jgi:prepilin-type processing-associated H-X9-DG protein